MKAWGSSAKQSKDTQIFINDPSVLRFTDSNQIDSDRKGENEEEKREGPHQI